MLAKNQMNYDVWFDLINLEISTKNQDVIRNTFEAAIKNKPPIEEKRYWRRYMYIWYVYAAYEELDAKQKENANSVYTRALKIVPHHKFTMTKLWIMYANFALRC